MEPTRDEGIKTVPASFWRRHPWLGWIASGLLVFLVAAAVIVGVTLHRAEPYMRARIVEELQDHFHARVELDSFHMSLLHGLRAEGKGLRIWPPAKMQQTREPQTGGPEEPLISLEEFRFHAPLHYEQGKPFHIRVVELRGLEIHVPPKSHADQPSNSEPAKEAPKSDGALLSLEVDTLDCVGAHLVLETDKPGRAPLDFAIARLKLTDLAARGAMGFDAELTNPKPLGTIYSKGSFGPWQVGDPGESPVKGDYRFEHADLGTFKGIAGILSSVGRYQGTLRDITVDGETDTPDFELTQFKSPLPLHTQFHAIVDGTNGDTWLEPVDAILGHSHFTVQGEIVREATVEAEAGRVSDSQPGGRDISLAVNVDRARIEDFLRLTSKSATPLMTGPVTVRAKLHIPVGSEPVVKRMTLNGKFKLDQLMFTSPQLQGRIMQLSLRGQGRPKELKGSDPSDIDSTMEGDFRMAGAVISLPSLTYTVPGAEVQLKGSYGVVGGALNFEGTAKMDATVSAMVGGWKGFLLKPVDRFFKKDGAGTDIPIHIRGTREHPDFGMDFDRMKSTSAEQPGDNKEQ
jgi:hypothetical protein